MEILSTQGPADCGPKYISLLPPPASSQHTSTSSANQPLVKNLPATAGDVGLIPHAMEQLSPSKLLSLHPRACVLEPVLCNKRSHCDEKPAQCSREEPPVAATGEGLRTAAKTQRSQI